MFKIISSELFNKVWSKWWTGFKEIHSHGLSQLPSAGRFSHLYWQSHLAGSHFALLLSFLLKCWFFFSFFPSIFPFLLRNFITKPNILDHSLLEYTWQSIQFCGKKRILRNIMHFTELFNDSTIHKTFCEL